MAVFNGNDLVLAVHTTDGSEVKFAHAQSASISFSNSLIDVTTKDSNSWDEMISGRKSFSISADGLVDFEAVTSAVATLVSATVDGFANYAIEGSEVFFEFERSTATSGAALGFSGSGFIESFEITAPTDDVSTNSVSIKGSGALVPTTVA